MPSNKTAKQRGRHAVKRLLPYAFLCTVGPSVTAATALLIVRILMCRYYTKKTGNINDEVCWGPEVGALTASVVTGLAVMDGIFSFLSTSYVQRFADKHGRRSLLYSLPILSAVATACVMVAYIGKNITLAWILLAATGVLVAASTKSLFVPSLVISDVANDEDRTKFYSRLEAVCLLGPGLAYIVSALSSRYIPILLFPYFIAVGAQLLSSVYAASFIPETLPSEKPSEGQEESSDDESEDDHPHTFGETAENVMEAVVAPVKPLGILLPRRDPETKRIEWRLSVVTLSLFTATCGTVFIPTASLLYLSDKFGFKPEQNGWVLAYLTMSKFVYILFIFPYLQRYGRKLFHWFQAKKNKKDPQRAPLLQRESFRKRLANEEANYFDVLLLFFSVTLDAVALFVVSFSQTPKQALVGYAFLALGAGDNPTYKSVFTSLVSREQGSETLAALDMTWNVARLISPMLLGGLYTGFIQLGKPELLFRVAGACCVLGAVLLLPLVILGQKARTI